MTQMRESFKTFLLTVFLYAVGNEKTLTFGFSSTLIVTSSPHYRTNGNGNIVSSKSQFIYSSPYQKVNTNTFNHDLFNGCTFSKYQYTVKSNNVKPLFMSDEYSDDNSDANRWISSNSYNGGENEEPEDWREMLQKRNDGSAWSSFESSDEEGSALPNASSDIPLEDYDEGESFLDVIASITADEIEFMNTEADRADKVRQMQEWGFEADSIAATLGVATDSSLERDEGDVMLEAFQEETAATGFGMYLDEDIDLETVESHAMVEKDEKTGESIRSQMVYVDEHSCIGCYNCATVAQSTFFMEAEHGRARVFQQWGDDDETVQIAIETCPVDCIHYVPYEELVRLEVERREQNINFKARLVNTGGTSVGTSNGPNAFTPPPIISGNLGSRCNNCPSRGCKNCPMYGVGKNPVFEEKERKRAERAAEKRIREQRESAEKSVDL